MSSRSRHHLTISDKNRLRRHHKQHPELTQEQLREWAYATFGQWVARSTVGHIVRAPEEVSANPEATRFQSGRYPDMEQELYAVMEARGRQLGVDVKRFNGRYGPVLSDAELWTKANEILKRTRGSDESVSVAWVHRFKKRHGLHRLQLKRAAAAVAATTENEVEKQQTIGEQHSNEMESAVVTVTGTKKNSTGIMEMENMIETIDSARKRRATAVAKKSGVLASGIATSTASAAAAAAVGTRSHFVSSDDILLLTHVLTIKPWGFLYTMDGWQQVVEKLRLEDSFRLEKTAGACQARMNLLLSHMKAGNTTALRKSGTDEEFDRKCALIAEIATQIEKYACVTQEGNGKSLTAVGTHVSMRETTDCTGIWDLTQDRERMAQRRLELMERKMDRELAAQKRHSEEQVARLEKLHHEQQQVQQEQHAQLLATIQQQQAMMFDFIKSLAPASNLNQQHQQL